MNMIVGGLTVTCAKYRCHRVAKTVELEVGEGAETFPNALCLGCAVRPDKIGTFEQPTHVPPRWQRTG